MPDLSAVWAVVDQGVADGAYPGATAVVATPDAVLGEYATGRQTYDLASPAVTLSTRYDLASVSKTFVAAGAMALVEEGRLDLEAPANRWLTELKHPDQQGISLRYLLSHQAGILSRADWHRSHATAESLWAAFFQAPVAFAPGHSVLYSSAGFMLVALMVERASGESLDRYLGRRLFEPLGLEETCFTPPPEVRPLCAPTEIYPGEDGPLQGIVHDENARLLGGVCGHTGIFSTAHDVAIFGRMLASGGVWKGRQVLKPDTVQAMFQVQKPGMWPAWGLGWMSGNPVFGQGFPGSFGHTGFTGTSLLVVPDRRLAAVLLTNRVCPTRQNDRIMGLRTRFHHKVAQLT